MPTGQTQVYVKKMILVATSDCELTVAQAFALTEQVRQGLANAESWQFDEATILGPRMVEISYITSAPPPPMET